jgi:hypothetical protein
MAARTPRVNPENTWLLYSALASEAGVHRPASIGDGRVVVGRLATGGEETVLVINASPDTVEAELTGSGAVGSSGGPQADSARDLAGLDRPLALAPYEVAVLEGGGVGAETGPAS